MDRGYYGAARGYDLEAAENGDEKAQNSLGTRVKFLEAPQGLLPEKE